MRHTPTHSAHLILYIRTYYIIITVMAHQLLESHGALLLCSTPTPWGSRHGPAGQEGPHACTWPPAVDCTTLCGGVWLQPTFLPADACTTATQATVLTMFGCLFFGNKKIRIQRRGVKHGPCIITALNKISALDNKQRAIPEPVSIPWLPDSSSAPFRFIGITDLQCLLFSAFFSRNGNTSRLS